MTASGSNFEETMTPVEKRDGIYFKRDDCFELYGVRGGKVRSAYMLIQDGMAQDAKAFVTAGSRMSPQCEIVSTICEALHIPCHLFMPRGQETSVIRNILGNSYSEIHWTKVGYNNVLLSYSRRFAESMGYYYIPFGMECAENIEISMHQVQNIPSDVKRIVVPCGSGMSMISVIRGLQHYDMADKDVVGVVVGKDPSKTFERFLGETCIKYSFVSSPLKYHDIPKVTTFCGIDLDPTYESKCIPFVNDGDMLWIVGHRRNEETNIKELCETTKK